LVVVLFFVTFVTFSLVNLLPGDVALAMLGTGATPEGVARVRLELGLNEPLLLRYVHWLAQMFRGEFGHSYIPASLSWRPSPEACPSLSS
jgi:peptide/nickel transport system permease protein